MWKPNVIPENLLQTPRFRVERLQRKLADGTLKQREIVRHPGSVVIVPLLNDCRVCLIRNFRMAVDRPLVELPAGTLEQGEQPADCAARELIEETGYRAGRLERLTSFYAAPGILDEHMHLFLATDLTPGPPQREAGEEIENLIVSWDEALAMIEHGEIRDAKTMVGLMFQQLWPRPLDGLPATKV
jgi:ADP-ribose pyrophosphatase